MRKAGRSLALSRFFSQQSGMQYNKVTKTTMTWAKVLRKYVWLNFNSSNVILWCCSCWYLGMAPRTPLLETSVWLLHSHWWQGTWVCTCVKLTLLSSHRKRRAELVLEQYPILFGRIWLVDVTRPASQRAHYHADVIYFLPQPGIKNGA